MSYYFTINTADPFPTVEVLEALRDPTIGWLGDEPGEKVFYKQGKSLRGVCIYPNDDGFEIGLNAFTTRDDAKLARDIVATASKALNCMVHAESLENPIPADTVYDHCDAAWIEDRFQEAFSITQFMKDQPPSEPMKIMGYRRGFAIASELIDARTSKTHPMEKVIEDLIQEGITVQEIDLTEDIYVPNIMSITADIKKKKQGWLGKKTYSEKETFVGFALPPGVRTLTPIFPSDEPEFAILGNKEFGYRRVAVKDINGYARRIGAREYGIGVFDLTVDGTDYDSLFRSGEAM